MNAIDVWAQITTERMAKRPWLETLLRWTARGAGAVTVYGADSAVAHPDGDAVTGLPT